jgi:diamine N-acetyltransferase
MNCSVEIATLNDLADLCHLGSTTFIQTYQGMGERPAGLDEAYAREAFSAETLAPLLAARADPSHPAYLLAKAEGRPAGFAKLEFTPPPDCVQDRNAAQLSQLYLLREFQGQGLGRILYDRARALMSGRGRSGVWLSVWEMNAPAMAFYQGLGFRQVGFTHWKFRYGELDYQDTDLIMYTP